MVSRRLTTQANHGNGDAAEDGDDDEGEDDGVGDVMVIITVMMMILLLEPLGLARPVLPWRHPSFRDLVLRFPQSKTNAVRDHVPDTSSSALATAVARLLQRDVQAPKLRLASAWGNRCEGER